MDVSIDKIGAQRNGAPIVRLSARLLAGQFQHRGQIEMPNRRTWRAFQDQFKLRHRFVEAPMLKFLNRALFSFRDRSTSDGSIAGEDPIVPRVSVPG